jgi:hypothetical protein
MEEPSKFAIHEAARDGRSKKAPNINPATAVDIPADQFSSKCCGIITECKIHQKQSYLFVEDLSLSVE